MDVNLCPEHSSRVRMHEKISPDTLVERGTMARHEQICGVRCLPRGRIWCVQCAVLSDWFSEQPPVVVNEPV